MFEAFKVKKIPSLFWSSEKTFTLVPEPLPLFMLLLGLFFITVGASIDFPLLFDELGLVTLLVLSLIAIKAAVLFVLSILFKMEKKQKKW